MKKYAIELTFREPVLGTVPKDKEIYSTYIKSKAEPEKETGDELETVEEGEDKGWTGFHLMDGKPILYDYVIKGFFKDACGMLRRAEGEKVLSKKLKAYKKVIDGLIFIFPRQIAIDLKGNEISILERPLRAQTAQGERVALAKSEICPVGSSLKIEVMILGGVSKKLLVEWLDYGKLRGLGQWRNAGYGIFEYKLKELKELKE